MRWPAPKLASTDPQLVHPAPEAEEITPGLLFGGRVAQKVGGVERGQGGDGMIADGHVLPLAVEVGCVAERDKDINGFGTLRARLGYAFDRAMIYGTGGLAFTNTELSLSAGGASVSDDDWSTGWTLGGGVEWAFMSNWSAKLEYLYVDLGESDTVLGGQADFNTNIVRAGLNYRF